MILPTIMNQSHVSLFLSNNLTSIDMKRFPKFSLCGQEIDVSSLSQWLVANDSVTSFCCPWCGLMNITRNSFCYHILNRCTILQKEIKDNKLLLTFLIKHVRQLQHTDEIFLILDICRITAICTALTGEGIIKSFPISELWKQTTSTSHRTLRRRFNRLSKSQAKGWQILLSIVDAQIQSLHCNSKSTCQFCITLVRDTPSNITETVTTSLNMLPTTKVPFITRPVMRPAQKSLPNAKLLPAISAKMKALIRKNLKGVLDLEKDLTKFNCGNKANGHSSAILSTLYQIIRVIFDDQPTVKMLKQVNLGKLLTFSGNFDRVLDFFTHASLPARTIARKISHIKVILEYLIHNSHNPEVRDQALRYSDKLGSYNYTNRPVREANAFKKDQKMKEELIKSGSFLTAREMTDLGNSALSDTLEFLNQLEGDEVINYPLYMEMQTAFIVALMLKGPCYRGEEYRMMTLTSLLRKGDSSWRCFVLNNKNRTRKERGAFLYFDRRFDFALSKYLAIRFRFQEEFQNLKHNCVFVNSCQSSWSTWSPLTAQQLTHKIRSYCHSKFPHFGNGTPMQLRFLQSAHIWSKYKQGEITTEQMKKLCVLFDRSLETWERDYTFTDDVIDRNPGEENNALLWRLSKEDQDYELQEIRFIMELKQQILKDLRCQSIHNTRRGKRSSNNQDLNSSETENESDQEQTTVNTVSILTTGMSEINQDETENLKNVEVISISSNDLWSENYCDEELVWIQDDYLGILLTNWDKNQIVSQSGWLTNNIIGSALTSCFNTSCYDKNEVEAPYYTLSSFTNIPMACNRSRLIQHVHIDGNHWILLDMQKNESIPNTVSIDVYDSLGQVSKRRRLPKEIMVNLRRVLPESKFEFKMMKCQQQYDGSSCGLFVIAFGVDLIQGRNVRVDYDDSRMRDHLLKCFEQRSFTEFPVQSL